MNCISENNSPILSTMLLWEGSSASITLKRNKQSGLIQILLSIVVYKLIESWLLAWFVCESSTSSLSSRVMIPTEYILVTILPKSLWIPIRTVSLRSTIVWYSGVCKSPAVRLAMHLYGLRTVFFYNEIDYIIVNHSFLLYATWSYMLFWGEKTVVSATWLAE